MIMSERQHFSEAAIIANYAMNRTNDPLGTGIESGYKHLLYMRKDDPNFCQEIFDEYAKSYRIMARAMIKERLRFARRNKVAEMKERTSMGLPAIPVKRQRIPRQRTDKEALKSARADFTL